MKVAGPLRGIVVADAYYPALNWISFAFNLVDEEAGDAVDSIALTTAREGLRSHPERVWWHVGDLQNEGWISINPGEYRRTPPPEPCLILEAPKGPPPVTRRSILMEYIEVCRGWPPQSVFEGEAILRAENLINRHGRGPVGELRNDIRAIAKIKSQAEYVRYVEGNYVNYFENLRVPLSIFASFMLLVRLQAFCGQWIQEDWCDNPEACLHLYVAEMLKEPETRKKIVTACEREYDVGREQINSALKGSMSAMPRLLALGWHSSQAAFKITRALKKAGFDEKSLPINPIIAEEAAVCSMTGLNLGMWFFLDDPDGEALSRISDNDVSETSLNKKARASASEIQPVFTRKFSEIISYQALTLSRDVSGLERGISLLNESRAKCDHFDEKLEIAWIDHALLKAYRRQGDLERAQQLGMRIAVNMGMRRQPIGDRPGAGPAMPGSGLPRDDI